MCCVAFWSQCEPDKLHMSNHSGLLGLNKAWRPEAVRIELAGGAQNTLSQSQIDKIKETLTITKFNQLKYF